MKNLALAAVILLPSIQALALAPSLPPSSRAVVELRAKYDPRIEVAAGALAFDRGCLTQKFILRGKDGLTGRRRSVRVRAYGELRPGRKSVVILPPTGGENFIDRSWARAFCGREMTGLIVEGWDGDNDVTVELGMHDRNVARALYAVEHAIEFLVAKGASSIGMLGTSVGAMTASAVMGFDDRIEAGALIVGGTDLPGIVAVSTEQTLTKLRAERHRAYGYRDAKAYEADLRARVKLDNDVFLENFSARPILFVTATEDVTVPTKFQEMLRARMGGGEELRLENDHMGAILKAYWSYTDRIAGFLEKNLR